MKILQMLKKLISRMRYSIALGQRFGPKVSACQAMSILFRHGKSSLGQYWEHRYNNLALNILKKKYLAQPPKDCQSGTIESDAPIWIFWWQGMESAPEVVQECVASVKRHAGAHPVIILDKNTFENYVSLPDFVLERLAAGDMNLTIFSDVLRFALLYQNGGIWMDATLFAASDFSSLFDGREFFTIRHNLYSDWHVCRGMWSSFMLACGKRSELAGIVYRTLLNYWKSESTVLHPFIIDLAIAAAYDTSSTVRVQIDSVPINNPGVFKLARVLEQGGDYGSLSDILSTGKLFKLSWHVPFVQRSFEKLQEISS